MSLNNCFWDHYNDWPIFSLYIIRVTEVFAKSNLGLFHSHFQSGKYQKNQWMLKWMNEWMNERMNEWMTNEVMTCLLFFTTYSPIFLHHVIIHGIPSFDARDGKNLKYFNCFMWLVQVSRLFSQILPFTLIKMSFFPVSYPFSITSFLNLKLIFGKNKKPVVNFALFHNV